MRAPCCVDAGCTHACVHRVASTPDVLVHQCTMLRRRRMYPCISVPCCVDAGCTHACVHRVASMPDVLMHECTVLPHRVCQPHLLAPPPPPRRPLCQNFSSCYAEGVCAGGGRVSLERGSRATAVVRFTTCRRSAIVLASAMPQRRRPAFPGLMRPPSARACCDAEPVPAVCRCSRAASTSRRRGRCRTCSTRCTGGPCWSFRACSTS